MFIAVIVIGVIMLSCYATMTGQEVLLYQLIDKINSFPSDIINVICYKIYSMGYPATSLLLSILILLLYIETLFNNIR